MIIEDSEGLSELIENVGKLGMEVASAVLVKDQQVQNVRVALVDSDNQIVEVFSPNLSANALWVERTRISDEWLTIEYGGQFSRLVAGKAIDLSESKRLTKSVLTASLKSPNRPGMKKNGRTGVISVKTARIVFMESHMRCMFRGCGKRLGQNLRTGDEGNYGYLAHIIPASEDGPRGEQAAKGECKKLVDAPDNLMLLCDKCHRLIDRIAVSDYPKQRLRKMRNEFQDSAGSCLDRLQFPDIPVTTFLWPIGGRSVSPPSSKEVSECLDLVELGWNGVPHSISDLSHSASDMKNKAFWDYAPDQLENAVQNLKGFTSGRERVAIFALGPMSALVALGSLVGSKTNIVAPLRSRIRDSWSWGRTKPDIEPFSVEQLPESFVGDEVVIQVSFTDKSDAQERMRDRIVKERGAGVVSVSVSDLSNDALAHPEEANLFSNAMWRTLVDLRERRGIKVVHLLMCASNMACFYLGRAVEQYAPKVRVYDFFDPGNGDVEMRPFLELIPSNKGVEVSSCF